MSFWSYVTIDAIFYVIVIGLAIYFLLTNKVSTKKDEGDGFPFLNIFRHTKRRRRSEGKNEGKCREILERVFQKPFTKIRPDFLKNPVTGKNLEIDCYNAEIKTPIGTGLGLEYDGEQHARYTPYFHKTKDDFLNQRTKDTWKDLQCKRQGILLIRVPHFVSYEDLEVFIVNVLRRQGMKV